MKYLHILIFCLSSTFSIAQRNVAWAPIGNSQNSAGWFGTIMLLEDVGYDFTTVSNTTYAQDNGILDMANQIDGFVGQNTNTLGIAHDIDGIAMRYAQLSNPNMTGMLLNGVPNQGSAALQNLTSPVIGTTTTVIQDIISRTNSIKSGDNCDDCNVVGLFEQWVDQNAAGSGVIGELSPLHPTMTDIVDTEPTIPYVVFYGTVEDYSLIRMLSSKYSPGSDSDILVSCYNARLALARATAIENADRVLATRVGGFFNKFLTLIGGVVSAASGTTVSIGSIITAGSNFLSSQRDRIKEETKATQERDRELARILRCETANKMLEAEWLLLMLSGLFVESEQEIPCNQTAYNDCLDECGLDMAWGDWDYDLTCEEYCEDDIVDCNPTETETVITFQIEPGDGLYSMSEQRLPGSNLALEVHLENTNHFQETFRAHDPMISALQDVFLGAAGPEFLVPKN